MFRFLNSTTSSVTTSAVIISVATLASRAVGIARDRILAHAFGAGPVLDAYYAAFKIPDLIYNLLIVGALTAGFIPVFTKLLTERDDRKRAFGLANNFITIIGVSLAVIGALGALSAPLLSRLIAPGFAGERFTWLVSFMRVMFLSPFLLGISMVLGGILQSLRQFVLYSIAPVFYNVGIIIGALFLTPRLGAIGLAWGVVLGAFLHLLVQMLGAYQNEYHWRWRFDTADSNTRRVAKLMAPRTIGLAVSQLNLVILTILASFLPSGSVAVYNFASNLQAVPIGLIGIPFALAVFPLLSEAAGRSDTKEFVTQASAALRQILFLILPATVLLLLLRAQVIRVVLGSGAFDWAATIATADALALFTLSLFAQATIPLLARGFYALNNTSTPLVIGVLSELVTIISALSLMKYLGVAGLALASSVGAVLNAVLLFIFLRQKLGGFEDEAVFRLAAKAFFAALLMACAIQLTKYPAAAVVDQQRFWGILLHGAISGTVGILVYGAACYVLRVQEMMQFSQAVKKHWFRLWRMPIGIDEAKKL